MLIESWWVHTALGEKKVTTKGNSAIDEVEWAVLRPDCFTRGKITPVPIILDARWTQTSLDLAGDRTKAVQPVALRYSDWATPAHRYRPPVLRAESRLNCTQERNVDWRRLTPLFLLLSQVQHNVISETNFLDQELLATFASCQNDSFLLLFLLYLLLDPTIQPPQYGFFFSIMHFENMLKLCSTLARNRNTNN